MAEEKVLPIEKQLEILAGLDDPTLFGLLTEVQKNPQKWFFEIGGGQTVTIVAVVQAALGRGFTTEKELPNFLSPGVLAQLVGVMKAEKAKREKEIRETLEARHKRFAGIKPGTVTAEPVAFASAPVAELTRVAPATEKVQAADGNFSKVRTIYVPGQGLKQVGPDGKPLGGEDSERQESLERRRHVANPKRSLDEVAIDLIGGLSGRVTGMLFGRRSVSRTLLGTEEASARESAPQSAAVARAQRERGAVRDFIARVPVVGTILEKQSGPIVRGVVSDGEIKAGGKKETTAGPVIMEASQISDFAQQVFGAVTPVIREKVADVSSWVKVNLAKAKAPVIAAVAGGIAGLIFGGVPGAVGAGLLSGMAGQKMADRGGVAKTTSGVGSGFWATLGDFGRSFRFGLASQATWAVLIAVVVIFGGTGFTFTALMAGFVKPPVLSPVAADIPVSPVQVTNVAQTSGYTNEEAKSARTAFSVSATGTVPLAGATYTSQTTIINKDGAIYKSPTQPIAGPPGYELDLGAIVTELAKRGISANDSLVINTVTATVGRQSYTATETIPIGTPPPLAFSCPVVNGGISCVSNSPKSILPNISCHHCGTGYPTDAAANTACATWEGNNMAMDVTGQANQEIYLPAINKKQVIWSVIGGGEDRNYSCSGSTQRFVSLAATVGELNYILQIHHLVAESVQGGNNLPSGTVIGNLACFDGGISSPHAHMQLSINGGFVPAENHLCLQ
jgi:hypothetical protein